MDLVGQREKLVSTHIQIVPAVVDPVLPLQPVAATACGEIVIEACGMKIRVPEGVSADHIERVLLAVQVAA